MNKKAISPALPIIPLILTYEDIHPTLVARIQEVFIATDHQIRSDFIFNLSKELLKSLSTEIVECQNKGYQEKEVCGWVNLVLNTITQNGAITYLANTPDHIKHFIQKIEPDLKSHQEYFSIYEETMKPLVEKSRLQKDISVNNSLEPLSAKPTGFKL